jgi:hypothetical protein
MPSFEEAAICPVFEQDGHLIDDALVAGWFFARLHGGRVQAGGSTHSRGLWAAVPAFATQSQQVRDICLDQPFR